MKCDKVRELIPFLDDESLEPETVETIWKHLEECPICRKEYHDVVDMLGRVRSTFLECEVAPVPEYLDIVMEKIAKKKKTNIFSYKVVAAAAVFIITVSIALYSLMNRHTFEPISDNYVMNGTLDEYDDYIASQYLTLDDLDELVGIEEVINEPIILDLLIASNFNNITPEDFIETMSEEEIIMLLASGER